MAILPALINAIASAPDEETHAGLLRSGARNMLDRPAGVAELVGLLLGQDDGETAEAATSLLAAALDEARMSAENDAPEGVALLDATEAAFLAQDAAAPFAPMQRLRLAQVYARAGLAPPELAQLSPDTMPAPEDGDSDTPLPNIADLLDPLLAEIGDQPLQVHAALTELFAGLPSELVAILISLIVARPGPVEARLGLYWLLHPDEALRCAAATALAARGASAPLPGDCATLLPTVRKWLPDGAARAALDTAIRAQMRHGLARPGSTPRIHRAAASLPDGVGAMSLVAAVQSGGRRGVAMAMLKQGHGVKDAFVIPCTSASDQKRLLARVLDDIETFDMSPDAWARMLALGLGEGQAAGLTPAPGILDLLELLGPDALVPAKADTAAMAVSANRVGAGA